MSELQDLIERCRRQQQQVPGQLEVPDVPLYRVHSMHGPTFHTGTDLQAMLRWVFDHSRNAGPYRVIEEATGREMARCDREDNGRIRSGSHILGRPWRIPIKSS